MVMQPLIIPVIRYTPKRRSLFEDFAFVGIGHEWFQCLLLCRHLFPKCTWISKTLLQNHFYCIF